MSRIRRLLEQIGNRSVPEVLAVYVGGSFAVLQAAALFIDQLGFPPWLFKGAVILLAVGLPVVLLTAMLQKRTAQTGSIAMSPARARARAFFTWRNAMGAGVLAFAFLGMAAVARRAGELVAGDNAVWARTAGTEQLERYIYEAKWDSAWSMAQRIDGIIPGDSVMETLRPKFARSFKLTTTPPGATIWLRRYEPEDTSWVMLGTATGDPVWIPHGVFEFRIEKPGYEPVFRTADAALFAQPVRLDSVGIVPEGMVRVRGGNVPFIDVRLTSIGPVSLADFFVDRYETTNREYKRFVDAGGYQNRAYWKEPFLDAGKPVPFDAAMARFVDRTGQPGPSTWEAGDFPEGEAEHPVGGLSWYEAAAYATYAGKSLPSIYHWNRVAGLQGAEWIMPFANFRGTATRPVSVSRAASTFGAYDVAGNVREWCYNETAGGRFILGGGVGDPDYMFTLPAALSPWDRSPLNGVRLATYEANQPASAAVFKRVDPLKRDLRAEKPVDDAVFEAFRRIYTFDPSPLDVRVEHVDSTHALGRIEDVSFNSSYGKRSGARLILPRRGTAPYQLVVWFTGSGALSVRDRERAGYAQIDYIVKSGRAVVFPIFEGMFERGDSTITPEPSEKRAYRDLVVHWSNDLSRTMEYIRTRPDIDTTRMAYLGLSLGSRVAPIMLTMVPQFKTAVLLIGGLRMQRSMPEVEPLNFAPRVDIPVLMLNGRYDFLFPLEESQRPLFQLLGTPAAHKRHLVYESAHTVPRAPLIEETLDWLNLYLGPVK